MPTLCQCQGFQGPAPPEGLAPQGKGGDLPLRLRSQHHASPGATTLWKPAPARGRKRGSCSPPQTLSVGHCPAQCTWSAAPRLGADVVGSWDKVSGPDWPPWESAGPWGWPGHAAAGWGLRGLCEPPAACQDMGQVTRSLSEQEPAASRGPGPGPHRPCPAHVTSANRLRTELWLKAPLCPFQAGTLVTRREAPRSPACAQDETQPWTVVPC